MKHVVLQKVEAGSPTVEGSSNMLTTVQSSPLVSSMAPPVVPPPSSRCGTVAPATLIPVSLPSAPDAIVSTRPTTPSQEDGLSTSCNASTRQSGSYE